MDLPALRQLLTAVADGELSVADASERLRRLPYGDLGFARVDHHRPLRQGMPEAIYGPGKTAEQCAAIAVELLAHGQGPVLLTRSTDDQRAAALVAAPGGAVLGNTVVWRSAAGARPERVVVATAGTADGPVADECETVLHAHGFRPERLDDVGVAGLHRLLDHESELAEADAVVVVAGMEGALASVVGGLTAAPVVAVPTSAGYGTSLGGVTALLSMLSSCAQGVTVVGIDNGFGAACAVARLCHRRASPPDVPTVAWFHCFSGIAGDMALGALLDAGADVDEVRATVEQLGIGGWSLHVETVQRGGLRASRALVGVDDHQPPPRRFADIRTLLAGGALPDRVGARALAVFTALADVEGHLHGVAPDDVHFHEVGALDAIVDVVGACATLEQLEVDEVVTSPVRVGLGSIGAEHGELPNPAPATLALLAGAGIAAEGVGGAGGQVELATPTGAALLAALAAGCGPLPPMTPHRIGYGAGGRDTPGRANVVQVVVGSRPETAGEAGDVRGGQPMMELAANIDDVTGEVLAHTVAVLLGAGANDAWITPIVMKKGRPAFTVHALCDPALAERVAAALVAESGTFGLRATTVTRWPQRRDELVVDVGGEPVRVKRSAHRVKAEHDDAARAAARLGRPLRAVLLEAEQAAAGAEAQQAEPRTP